MFEPEADGKNKIAHACIFCNYGRVTLVVRHVHSKTVNDIKYNQLCPICEGKQYFITDYTK